jgi:wobble nucleotide-excising tRNase
VLKKIVRIRNVGRFKDCKATGDVEFRKATLVYAPNGRGKTTFCDICRSLKTGVADTVVGRTTLGTGVPPTVDLLLDTGLVRFKDGAWSSTLPDLEIFDSRFIHDNVYAGECVEHDQRRNLYGVIIGEQGVALRRAVDELDDTFREAGQFVSEKEAAVHSLVHGGMSVEQFVALKQDPDIDAKIDAKSKQVAALNGAADLKAKPTLKKITLPSFPAGLDVVLSKTVEDVSEDAEAAIRAHMAEHMQRPNEPWLVEGLGLVKGKSCPFCAQSLSTSPIIALYRTYFAGKYENLKTEIEQWTNRLRNYADETAVLALERTTHENTRLVAEWQAYITGVGAPTLDVPRVHEALTTLRGAGLALLDAKGKSPLEPATPGDDFAAAHRAVDEAAALVDAYNLTVDAANGAILAKKEETEGGDAAEAKQELEQLRTVKVRQQDNAKKAVQELRAAREARTKADLEKQAAKAALEHYSRDVFQRYQARINQLLANFGATFRIEKAREHYLGGKPSSTYCLVIEGEEVELGDTNTPLTKPSFKNTLSAGDKSALALAFFLAQLAESVDLSKKIVVLDDPFTSQDASRQICTQQEIHRLAGAATQVVVLSHEKRFLKRVWDSLERAVTKTLQFSVLGDTTVTEWDIETAVQDEYVATYTKLWRYCNRNDGDPQLVVRTIRPLLEGYLRMKLPNQFPEDKWLGDYVKQIEDADPNTPVGLAKPLLPELEYLRHLAEIT